MESIIPNALMKWNSAFATHVLSIQSNKYMIMVNILVSQITCNKATGHAMSFGDCSS